MPSSPTLHVFGDDRGHHDDGTPVEISAAEQEWIHLAQTLQPGMRLAKTVRDRQINRLADATNAVRFQRALAGLAFMEERYADSFALDVESIALSTTPVEKAVGYFNLASTCLTLGEPRRALRFTEKSLALAATSGAVLNAIPSLLSLGEHAAANRFAEYALCTLPGFEEGLTAMAALKGSLLSRHQHRLPAVMACVS